MSRPRMYRIDLDENAVKRLKQMIRKKIILNQLFVVARFC